MKAEANAPLIKGPDGQRPCFLVTVDTEGDNLWARPRTTTTANASFLPRFQTLCESRQLRPTYLVNFEMATSPRFVEFGRDILKRGAGEIGMHLHAWDSPPLVPLTADDWRNQPYLTEYCPPVMREKISFMTGLLEDTFGVKMTSHRAGRWGFNGTYARILEEKGYLADSSVTPHVSWAEHMGDPSQSGGPDYSNFPEAPYFLDLENIAKAGNSRLLEIPVASMDLRPGLVRAITETLVPDSLASRALNHWFPAICWLNPIHPSTELTLRLVETAAAENRPCMQAFHSSELMPGGSPRFPREEDVERLYDGLQRVFEVASQKFRGATVTEFRMEFSNA
jgi:hypothetical protein